MKRKTKLINFIMALVYIVLIAVLGFSIYGLSGKYQDETMKMITEIERTIKEALETEDNDKIKTQLEKLHEEKGVDIVITENEELVFNSVPYREGDNLVGRVNPKVIAREARGYFPTKNKTYYVWHSIYKLDDGVFVNSFLWSVVTITIIVMILMSFTIAYIYKSLLDPLRNIKKSIQLAEEYQFDDISESEDVVNKNFKKFANRLEGNISAVSREYTKLENQLQNKSEHLNNTLLISSSMIHDLKTPVHQNILENEVAQRNSKIAEVIEITKRNQEVNHEILLEINTILKMLHSEDPDSEVEKTNVEIVGLITRSIDRFAQSLSEKNLYVNFDAPEKLDLLTEEPALILLVNNLISNMVQYSSRETELNITVDEIDNKVVLSFKNEASQDDIERMSKTRQLFNAVENPKDGKHTYSSGHGLYLIKDLTEMLEGEYSLRIEDGIVNIEVVFMNEK